MQALLHLIRLAKTVASAFISDDNFFSWENSRLKIQQVVHQDLSMYTLMKKIKCWFEKEWLHFIYQPGSYCVPHATEGGAEQNKKKRETAQKKYTLATRDRPEVTRNTLIDQK